MRIIGNLIFGLILIVSVFIVWINLKLYSDNFTKKEKREDEIIKMKTMPGRVFKFCGQQAPERGARSFEKRVKNPFCTHYPEHVKATKGIKGIKSFRAVGCC